MNDVLPLEAIATVCVLEFLFVASSQNGMWYEFKYFHGNGLGLGFLSTWKDWVGGGQMPPSELSYLKSDDDETWYGYTTGKNVWWRHRHVDFMTSSKWDSWKSQRFSRVWLNISKTVQLIFTKLKSFLDNHI